MVCRAVRRWLGKRRRWWHVQRLTVTIAENWDEWLGALALKGVDPRGWDLNQMLAAYEMQIRATCKDDAEWQRRYNEMTREPADVRRARRAAEAAGVRAAQPQRMSVADAERLMASFAASDARYS